ncbi:MAG: GNAT family N-acetyltransferase [Sphingomonas sp.]|nr:GNAT family N-acetyltransferase [Sphingomonas sp.]
MLEVEYRTGLEGLRGLSGDDIVALTRLATAATFYSVPLTKAQVAANERIPAISASAVFEAAKARHQHLVTAFIGGRLAGYMIATRHSKSDLELDWLMVDPAAHGTGVAASLMSAGLAWLGTDRPVWLTVIRHNGRAIGFYRKFGFEIDPGALIDRPVPTWIMRRRPGAPVR